MDPPQDNGSQPTVPSQHGDLVSNLSTMPNISSQNDPGFEDIQNNQRHFDSQHNRENNFPLYSQKVVNNRSHSFDQGNKPLPSLSSAPPHLNQAQFHEESKENTPMMSNSSSRKVYQLTTFHEGWEHELKQEEQEREKNYQNHVLFNQQNEPLLSQGMGMDQHDFIHTDNEPLLSQTVASDHNFSLTQDNDPLLSQHIQPESDHHLNSINQLAEQAKSQSSRSNQLKFYDVRTITEEQQIQHSQTKSQSNFSQVALKEPLFDLGLIDESQSNLLKFGFTVNRNDRKLQISQQSQSNHSNNSQSISINRHINQQEGPSQHQIKNEQQPNIIQSEAHGQSQSQPNSRLSHQRINEGFQQRIPLLQSQSQSQNNSRPHAQRKNEGGEERIIIHVSDCNSQNINSVTKNNDIYGIIPPESNHIIQNAEQEWRDNYPKIEQRQEEEERNQENNHYSAEQQAKLQQFSLKLDNIDNEQKKQPQNNSRSNPFHDYSQKQQQHYTQNAKQAQPQQEHQLEEALTVEQIAYQMHKIVHSQGTGVQLTERGVKLLKNHVDCLFIKPLSDIGRQIMSNGQTAVNLIKIILFKESDNQIKDHLRKYLILVFARNVRKNPQALMDFQIQTTSSIHRNHPPVIENDMNLHHSQNQDIGLSSEPVIGAFHVPQSVDQSVQAENGSSTKKHAHEQMDIDDGQRQPVKRTIPTKILTESRNPSPRSGKVTRRTKYKSKGKGKTTSKKITVQFQQSSQSQYAVPGTYVPPKSKSRKKGQKKQTNPSPTKKESSMKMKNNQQQEPHPQNLGSKFTFVFRENTLNHNKQLVQRRVSQRLVGKSSASKIQSQNIYGRSASRGKKEKRVSSGRKYQEQEIDISYVKKHFRNISFKSSMMQRDYEALTPEDAEILRLYKSYYEIVDQESRLPQIDNNQSYDHPQNEEDTQSVRSQTYSIRQRKEEFKKNISKYKVGEIPIIILRIVDPDINNHGIYALLELARLSQEVYNARYALTPITNLERASKRLIDMDLAEAKRQVGDEEKDNLVYMKPTGSTLDLIKAEKEKRERLM